MYILGLTGSIGTGKSTAGEMFKDAGIPLLDADEQVHKLYAKGGLAVEPVGAAFPGCVVNEAVDRTILSTYVLGKERFLSTGHCTVQVHDNHSNASW